MAQETSVAVRLKSFAKRMLSALFFYSGLEWVMLRTIGTRTVTILAFHSVNYNKYLPPATNFSITPEEFEKKLRFLRRYNVISMDELIDSIDSNRRPPRNSMVLTFDDGYRDNYSYAFPLLRDFNMPATIFLTSAYIGSEKWLHLNAIYFLISTTKKARISVATPGTGEKLVLELDTNAKREDAKYHLMRLYKKMESGGREAFIQDLTAALSENGAPAPSLTGDLGMLDWQEVVEMAGSGLIGFGSHTRTHLILSRGDIETVTEELSASKKEIEEKTGVPVRHFCFPNGHREDYERVHLNILRRLGYRSACTMIEGTNPLDSPEELYELRRLSGELPNHKIASKIMLKR